MKILNNRDKLDFKNTNPNANYILQSFNSDNEFGRWIKIGNELIKLLENVEINVEYSKNKRANTEIFYYETVSYMGEKINIEIVAKSLANKIINYFNDENIETRNIPISEIVIIGVITNDAEIKFFCKFR